VPVCGQARACAEVAYCVTAAFLLQDEVPKGCFPFLA